LQPSFSKPLRCPLTIDRKPPSESSFARKIGCTNPKSAALTPNLIFFCQAMSLDQSTPSRMYCTVHGPPAPPKPQCWPAFNAASPTGPPTKELLVKRKVNGPEGP